MKSTLAASAFLLAAATAFGSAGAIVKSEFIYERAPYPSCHASTIVETSSGKMVAAWFGGTHEKHPDVGIWASRLENGRWTEGVEVANGVQPDGTRHPTWNPVLFQPRAVGAAGAAGRKGRGAAAAPPLMLFYKVGPTPQTWWGMVMTSTDDGRTWSAPRRLPDEILGPIKNKPVQLADGTILSGTSDETPERPSKWRVYFERSTDGGQTWTRTGFLNDGVQIGAIQPSILVHGGSRLQAVGRTRQGKVFSLWSDDLGRTWGPMSLLDVPNPSAGTDAVTLRDGRHLLVYNDTPKGRTPLSVALSRDGREWRSVLQLETEPGEYSYPAVIQTADGRVHITYTWKRERIKYVVLDPARLP
jgi:predicted neuraminidase